MGSECKPLLASFILMGKQLFALPGVERAKIVQRDNRVKTDKTYLMEVMWTNFSTFQPTCKIKNAVLCFEVHIDSPPLTLLAKKDKTPLYTNLKWEGLNTLIKVQVVQNF